MLECLPKRSLRRSWAFEAVLHSQVLLPHPMPQSPGSLQEAESRHTYLQCIISQLPVRKVTPGSLILGGVGPRFVTGDGHGQATWCDSEGEYKINIHCQIVHFPHDSIIGEKLVGLIR